MNIRDKKIFVPHITQLPPRYPSYKKDYYEYSLAPDCKLKEPGSPYAPQVAHILPSSIQKQIQEKRRSTNNLVVTQFIPKPPSIPPPMPPRDAVKVFNQYEHYDDINAKVSTRNKNYQQALFDAERIRRRQKEAELKAIRRKYGR